MNSERGERGQTISSMLLLTKKSYLPLSRLLNLYVAAVQGLYRATATFLGHGEDKVPFLIGLAGSVAVGKSTAARALPGSVTGACWMRAVTGGRLSFT